MPNYQNGKIYKLWSPQGEEIYIGSTTQSLAQRKQKHKRDICSSKILFEKYDDVRIELIEEYPCKNKMELERREGHHIRNNNCINKYIAGRTTKEYREDNKEEILEYLKKWREDNKEYDKKYREDNKDKLLEYQKEYYEDNREKKKEYYEDNKEYKLEYQKEYREKNKEEIKEYNKEWYKKNKLKLKRQASQESQVLN